MLLAMDTATRRVGIALHDGNEVRAECVWTGTGHPTVDLAPEVTRMLRREGVAAGGLTGVAVAVGPGSYTGLRIGLALAKGVALAHHLPMVGIPTLEILARGQPRREEPMLTVLQAGRGRVAGVWYKWKGHSWQATSEVQGLTWAEVLKQIGQPTYVCGEIDAEGRELLHGKPLARVAPPALCVRRPSFLAELAWERLRAGKKQDPASVTPVYLQGPSEPTA